MSEIASGTTGNQLSRAADVTHKERRRLVLMVRETPLHRNHPARRCPSPRALRDPVPHAVIAPRASGTGSGRHRHVWLRSTPVMT